MFDWILFAIGMAWAFLLIELDYRQTIKKERRDK